MNIPRLMPSAAHPGAPIPPTRTGPTSRRSPGLQLKASTARPARMATTPSGGGVCLRPHAHSFERDNTAAAWGRRPLTIDDLTLMIASNSDYETHFIPNPSLRSRDEGVQGLHKSGYGTPVTLIGDKAADRLQAAYFRRSLRAERAQPSAEIRTRGDNIANRTDTGSGSATHPLGSTRERGSSGVVSRPTHRQARPSLRDSTGSGLTA